MSEFIRTYPNTLDSETCRAIIEKYLADPRKRNESAEVGGFHQAKSSLDLNFSGLDGWEEFDEKTHTAINGSLNSYIEDCPSLSYALNWPIRDNGFQIQHYRANGRDCFDWHVDIGGRMQPDGLRCATRLLAGILYLNTVDEGGETEFSIQRIKLKPEEGTMVWFPVSFEYPHRGCTPVSGPKFIISTFIGYAE